MEQPESILEFLPEVPGPEEKSKLPISHSTLDAMAKVKDARMLHQKQVDALGQHLRKAGRKLIRELLELDNDADEQPLVFQDQALNQAVKELKKSKK